MEYKTVIDAPCFLVRQDEECGNIEVSLKTTCGRRRPDPDRRVKLLGMIRLMTEKNGVLSLVSENGNN